MNNKVGFLDAFARDVINNNPVSIAATMMLEDGTVVTLWHGAEGDIQTSFRELLKRLRNSSQAALGEFRIAPTEHTTEPNNEDLSDLNNHRIGPPQRDAAADFGWGD